MSARDPIVCYVTDRTALGGIPAVLEAIGQAAAAGVDWIQLRERTLDARELLEVTRSASAGAIQNGARLLVNDRLDVALAGNAGGVHLGENSLPVECVSSWRRSAGRTDFLIGVSCHSAEAARAAERGGADYIFFGPVFATPSKAAFGAAQGIDRLSEICRFAGIPVLAIGGITVDNAASCAAAGAAGIAAIRLFQETEDVAGTVARLRSALTRTSAR